VTPPIRRWLRAALASTVLVAASTAVNALLEPHVPALGLGVLYLLAVVPIALVYGSAAASVVSVASLAAFNYFFLPPRYTLDPGTSQDWSVLVAALVVSQLAARSQRETRRSARLADQQAHLAEEQAALRRVATLAARGTSPEELLATVVEEVGRAFPVESIGLARYESGATMTTGPSSSSSRCASGRRSPVAALSTKPNANGNLTHGERPGLYTSWSDQPTKEVRRCALVYSR
jgi:K+-sensing histidine kinase KdpD